MQVAGLVLIGGGGHALVVAEAALLSGRTLAGFLDDDPAAPLSAGEPSCPRLGRLHAFAAAQGSPWVVCLGDLGARRALIDALPPVTAAAVVHPRAFVSPSATLGPGAFLGPGAVVHARARIGAHAIVNSGAIVEHDCLVGENSHVAPGAAMGGGASVGPDSLVGLGSRVLPLVRVGARCTVGAGAVAAADVPDGVTVKGVPARA